MEENKNDFAEKTEDLNEQLENINECTESEQEVDIVNDELKAAEDKAKEYLDKYQRLMAEFYNFRERTTKEKASMYNDGVRDTVEKILPIVDNIERAVSAQKEKLEDDSFIKGVDMILKQFKEILNSMGVEEIPAVGEKFNPNIHSAVSHIEDSNFEENTICVEMLKGYIHKGKVIRHSMVQVANWPQGL